MGPTERRIALVSGCDDLRYASHVSHQLYARRHCLGYHLELAPFEGHRGYWHKVRALLTHLDDYDWLVWLDDDAFITALGDDFIAATIADAEEAGAAVAIAPSVPDELNGAWAAYNSGVLALRNTPAVREMLELALDPPLDEIRAWWDAERLGVFTQGDQDVFVWYLENGRGDLVHWVDPMRWNARPWHYRASLDEHPVCHFPGHPDKTLAIAEFAARMGTGPTLVAGSSPARGLLTRPTAQLPRISTASLVTRRLIRRYEAARKRVVLKARWIKETGRWS